MKARSNFLIGCLIGMLAPAMATAQKDVRSAIYTYTYNQGGSPVSSNVPLNEINPHAYRNFQHIFPAGTSNEYWFASQDGYQVSFDQQGRHHQAFFDRHGTYRFSLQYYPGTEIPRIPGDLIKAEYPDYRIDVVTEITDGEKIFHLVKIISPTSIKTLSVADGKVDVLETLSNGTAEAPLISLRFAH